MKTNMQSLTLKSMAGALALAMLVAACGCGDNSSSAAPGGNATATTTPTDSAATGAIRPTPTAPGVTVTGDTVTLGIVGSESGDQAPWGKDEIAGARLAVEDFNKSGKLKGKTVKLDEGDSASKPEQGKSAADKLAADNVIAIIGEVASGITAPMSQVAFDHGLPIVAVGATRTDLSHIGSNFFRVCYTDALQGPVMATFAYKELGLRKMAVITDKKLPYSTGLSDSFKAFFIKLGGQIVDEEFYQAGDIAFKGQLTKAKAASPDGLFMSGYFTETGPLAKQARQAGITGPLMGGDGWDSSQILISGGDAIKGAFFCNHYNNKDTRPQVVSFLKEWQDKYHSLPGTTMAALGYDATMLVCDALTRAKGLDSKDLIDALADTVNFPGVTGDITLKGMNGDPPKRAIVVQLDPSVGGNGQKFAKAYEYSEVFGDQK